MYDLGLSEKEELLASRIYDEAIVFDGLLPWGPLYHPEYDDYTVENFLKGGITAANFTIGNYPYNFPKTIDRIVNYKKKINEHSNKLILIKNISDIKKAKKEKKLGIVFGFQDAVPIENNLGYLDILYDLGVRIIQLTYNAQNYVGSGCCELHYGKLTYFGREVVKKMNELGIAIDLSHCSKPTTLDAIECSDKPVYITHSSVYSLCTALNRNKTDEEIKTLAEKGGVIGICLFPPLVRKDRNTNEVLPSSVEDVIDHIEYVINLVGVDHVAFGSDVYDYWTDNKIISKWSSLRYWRPLRPDVFGVKPKNKSKTDPPIEGLENHLSYVNLSRGLVKRGFKKEEIKKVLGENVLRVLGSIWKN